MSHYYVYISCLKQELNLYCNNKLTVTLSISTGINGEGQMVDTGKTPLGWHCIAEKYGDLSPVNTVFIARKETGEIYSPEMKLNYPDRDWILTRILRLKGLEPGINLGGSVDTYQRYIYIHGTPDDVVLGVKGSKGCIRVKNSELITLYEHISIGTPVYISDR